MYELADFFVHVSQHTPNVTDYTRKYQVPIADDDIAAAIELAHPEVSLPVTADTKALPVKPESALEETPLYLALKQYRLEKSRAEGVKAYFLYNK